MENEKSIENVEKWLAETQEEKTDNVQLEILRVLKKIEENTRKV